MHRNQSRDRNASRDNNRQNVSNPRRQRTGSRDNYHRNPSSQYQMGGNHSRRTENVPTHQHRSSSEGRPSPTVNPTLDFNFLKDDNSIRYMNSSRIMFILRGLPGSGKSTLAQAILANYDYVKLLSADDYFVKRGIYRFDPSQLRDAHEWCKQQITIACEGNQFNIVIVDNTNIKVWEMEFYINLANATNFVVFIVEPKTAWKWNVGELNRRNIHRVPFPLLKKKLSEYENIIPKFFGWFLNEADSAALYTIAQAYYEECMRNEDFKKDYKTSSSNFKDIKSYFCKNNFDDLQKIFHCTANFMGDEDVEGYANRKSVTQASGKAFTLHVIGFVITPRTFGARIKLNDKCLQLWNQRDTDGGKLNNVDSLIPSLSKMQLNEPSGNRPVANGVINSYKRNVKNTNCVPTLHWAQSIGDRKSFCPTSGKGSRAHFTLACAPNISNVQTGFDLVNIIHLEKQLGNRTPNPFFYVQNGIAGNFGNGQWVIYLDRRIEMKAIFASSY